MEKLLHHTLFASTLCHSLQSSTRTTPHFVLVVQLAVIDELHADMPHHQNRYELKALQHPYGLASRQCANILGRGDARGFWGDGGKAREKQDRTQPLHPCGATFDHI